MNKESWIAIFWCVLVIVGVLMGCYFIMRAECYQKAEGIGVPIYWNIIGGCRIEIVPGKIIPLDAYYWKEEGMMDGNGAIGGGG